MSEQKKDRKMTAKGFLHKSSKQGAKSAEGFIAAHRAWLETGELSQFTSPILAKLDAKEVYPTPALNMLRDVVLGHHLAQEAAKAEASMQEGPKTEKAWRACILDSKGEEQEHASFDLSSDADRWVDRRLFDGAPDHYGMVESTKMVGKDGKPLATIIQRQDAIARILAKPKGAAMKRTGGSTNKLSFGAKAAVQTRVTFSHG